ncbi:DEAD/DEAH box helicase [Chlamydia pneumoniae]|uniref:DEAD/DEAH box helicase n=1 Tax=Chlamydia pneumoniae TaxID=83558 RepID=UPI00000CCD2B|nr:DEAD/DEAH box helicase [Chlamydia pneumoniae]BAA99057.1 SWI/SNF family helicase_2 [Chlamydia pneumoniae J138]
MLNFRKLRRDFSANILQDGKKLFEQGAVIDAKILSMNGETVCISAQVRGLYDNIYECEIEVDRSESDTVDSNCDCSYNYDCQHIVALLFYLEQYFNEMVVAYARSADLETDHEINEEVKKELKETFVAAATKEEERKDREHQKEILREYVHAANALSANPFFLPLEYLEKDSAELAVLFVSVNEDTFAPANQPIEFQLVLRLPCRSKPFYISNIRTFLEGVLYQEPIVLNGRRFFFTMQSFNASDRKLIDLLIRYVRYPNHTTEEKLLKSAYLMPPALGVILAKMFEHQLADRGGGSLGEKESFSGLFCGNLEEPLCWSLTPAKMKFNLDFFDMPYKALLMTPVILVDDDEVQPEQTMLLESDAPGIIHHFVYHRFSPQIKRAHLRSFSRLRDIAIPEALFGSFRENALPVFQEYAEIANVHLLNSFVTLPYVDEVRAICDMSYLDGELEAKLHFLYGSLRVPAASLALQYQDVRAFISDEGILARNLVEERKMLEEVFSGFIYDERDGAFRVKSEKKIVEFMTETIPANQHRITFNCPENLSGQFIYDETIFELSFREGSDINYYEADLKVHGLLKGVPLDLLWDCISAKKRFLELPKAGQQSKGTRRGKVNSGKLPCILVLDLEKIAPVVQIFNEIGFKVLDDLVQKCPLWSLTGISLDQFEALPVNFSMSERLIEIQKQIRGEIEFDFQDVPQQIQATLRSYQTEGVHWLERLRKMHLNGILADDMGLGKTLQAIIAVTQSKLEKGSGCSLIVCPTSLVYNWKEEFRKFNPEFRTLVIDGVPSQRRKQLTALADRDVAITSYNLLQKDVELYKSFRLDYVVLDEAHHIKNRTTRNAKSVKMIQSDHRLILTGTPIENSLEELWSLFDFLMPGLLSSYDRFVGKYIRTGNYMGNKADNMVALKKKVSPFILRRMKEDVLKDLPPVSEILYHCHLTESQKELYQSYAASAKQELSRLVKQEGFERIHIHVLATLTRLKQICCHPAIFAKDAPEPGDSAKYDMLMDLLSSLVDSGHKTVVFSQYTKMLGIIKKDLESRGIPFVYLDGSTKNRLDLVNQFNEDPSLLVFLISLKAGGTGLNLVGADTVIHYDMWWNPAVENQATDRVHRIGQSRSVSSYKLVTLNTIEEKILTLQNRKKSLVKKVINSDDEVVSKLTWEEVLELLQI